MYEKQPKVRRNNAKSAPFRARSPNMGKENYFQISEGKMQYLIKVNK